VVGLASELLYLSRADVERVNLPMTDIIKAVEQVFNEKLAADAVKAAGGPVKIGKCTE